MHARPSPFVRFLVGHTLAYVPGFLWAAAWIPTAIEARLGELASGADEAAVRSLMMRAMIAPFLVAFVVPHLLVVPWMRAEDGVRGRGLLLAGTALESIAAVAYGAWAWWHLLTA